MDETINTKLYHDLVFTNNLHHKQNNQYEKKNKRQQHQEPSNAWGSCAADQVQNPCPKQDIQCFDCKDQKCTCYITTVRSDTVFVYISKILENHDD